jgi:glycosyltransferase involved in cell wall biosynthesis
MGQYAGRFDQLACVLFEHDLYFQAIQRSLSRTPGLGVKFQYAYEYMRALRYELSLLPRFDQVQVCSERNGAYLRSYLPSIAERIDSEHRSGIDLAGYQYREDGREPLTMLFLGSFRHQPNVTALNWLVSEVLPLVLKEAPAARLIVVGSGAPPGLTFDDPTSAVELLGFVEDVREPLSRYSVFVCPILAGSGMRVKLLEAFASGIPVVSTSLGAEGLTAEDGSICSLADDPATFARKILELLHRPELGTQMAQQARRQMESRHNMPVLAKGLVESYRRTLERKRRN